MALRDRDESSPRYPGWRVVAACFLMALFGWGFGLYGHGVYLAELQRLHGWPASLISAASTTTFLVSAVLTVFTAEALERFGPRRLALGGIAAMACATAAIPSVTAPWQLFAAYGVMAFGIAGLGTTTISSILALWFARRGGLALSLALNGASTGGIVIAPALIGLGAAFGFTTAMLVATAAMIVVLVPAVVFWIDRPAAPLLPAGPAAQAAAPAMRRAALLRNSAFWTVSGPAALALLAQIGVLVHQIAFLEPLIGRAQAGLAVVVTTVMAVIGRLALGTLVDRLDSRRAMAGSLLSQVVALGIMIVSRDAAWLIAACAIYGFSVGNMITLPPLIIRREFSGSAFAMVMGMSSAVATFIGAFGPAVLGVVRDVSGGYAAALALCIAFKIAAAIGVTLRRGAAADTA